MPLLIVYNSYCDVKRPDTLLNFKIMLVFDFSMGVIACDNYIKSYTFMGNCSSYNLKC